MPHTSSALDPRTVRPVIESLLTSVEHSNSSSAFPTTREHVAWTTDVPRQRTAPRADARTPQLYVLALNSPLQWNITNIGKQPRITSTRTLSTSDRITASSSLNTPWSAQLPPTVLSTLSTQTPIWHNVLSHLPARCRHPWPCPTTCPARCICHPSPTCPA